jgi:hypothetical protein
MVPLVPGRFASKGSLVLQVGFELEIRITNNSQYTTSGTICSVRKFAGLDLFTGYASIVGCRGRERIVIVVATTRCALLPIKHGLMVVEGVEGFDVDHLVS